MLVETISSRQNPLVKRLISVRDGRERHLIFLEGVRLIEDALRSGVKFDAVAYSSKMLETDRGRALFESLRREACRGAMVTDALMASVSDVETPPGVVALGFRPSHALEDLLETANPLLILVDGLQDPGNLGALIRTAEAVGATGLIVAKGSADPFQLKAVRASAGAALRLPVVTGVHVGEIMEELRKKGLEIVAADAGSDHVYTEFDWSRPCVLWLGSEATGLAGRATVASTVVAIPMVGEVESLNITVAASLLLFEAAHQRGTFTGKPTGPARPASPPAGTPVQSPPR